MTDVARPLGVLLYDPSGQRRVVPLDEKPRTVTKPKHWSEALARALTAAAATAAGNKMTLDQGRQLLWRRAMTRMTRRIDA